VRKPVIPAILFCLIAFSVAAPAQDEQERRYTEIEGLIEDGLVPQAIERIEAFLRDFPAGSMREVLRFKLAELQFGRDDYEAAVPTLETFLTEHPASPRADEARFLLASGYRLTGRLAEAMRELTNLLRNRNLDERLRVACLERRADIALQQANPEEALKDLEDLVRRAPTPLRRLKLANVDYDLGRFKQAESEYARLREEGGLAAEEQRTVDLRLALVMYERDRFRQVVELLQPLRERYRDDSAIMMTLAWSLYRLNRFQEAYEIVAGMPADPASELTAKIREGRSLLMVHEHNAAVNFFEAMLADAAPAPALAPAYRALSDAYFAIGDVSGGIGALERMAPCLEDDSERFELWVEVGKLYEERANDRIGAVSAYRKALAVNPRGRESEEVLVGLLRDQMAISDLGGASETISSFLDDFPESRFLEEVLFISGNLLERVGEDERALEQYRRIAQYRGDSPFRAQAYEAGLELVKRLRRWEEVTAIGREYLQEFPQANRSADVHLAMAEAYYHQGQYRDGLDHYEQALTAETGELKVSSVLLNIGWGYYKLGNLKQAEENYLRVVDNYPGTAEVEEAFYWLGWIAQVGGNLERANDYFDRLLKSFPDSRYAEISLWQVANNLLRRDRTNDALTALNAIVDRYPDGQYAGSARIKLIETYVVLGNFRAALDRISVFVDNDPGRQVSPSAMLAKGDALAEAGNRKAALQTFRRLLERFPASEVADEATLNIGILQFQMGNYSEAVTELRKLAEYFPDSDKIAAAAYYLGQSLMRMRRYEDAIEQFRAALARRGGGSGAEILHYLIGVCYEQLGNGREAAAAYKSYLAGLSEGDAGEQLERRLEIARLFARNGFLDDAATQLRGIIAAAKDSDLIIQAQFALGAVLEQQGLLAEAAVEYLKVTYVHSSSPLAALSARFKAGQLFERLGQYQEAINVYEKIAENHKGTRFAEVAAMRIEALRKRMAEEENDQSDRTSHDKTP
jgi:TolA-binding protein